MIGVPLVYLDGNVAAAADGSWWAGYKVQPRSTEFANSDALQEEAKHYLRLLWGGVGEGMLVRLCHTRSVEDYLQELAALGSEQNGAWSGYCEKVARYLDDREPVARSHYLFLRLDVDDHQGTAGFRQWRAEVERLFGVGQTTIRRSAFALAQAEERRLSRHVSGCFRAEPLEVADWLWYMARLGRRGVAGQTPSVGPPAQRSLVEVKGEDLVIRPVGGQLRVPFEISTNEGPRSLYVDSEDGLSYQAHLCLADMPPVIEFPGSGSEWIYGLDLLPFPVDACIRFRCQRAEEAVRVARKKRLELEGEIEHFEKAGVRPEIPTLEASEEAEALLDMTKATRQPLVWCATTLCVYGDEGEELEARVDEVRNIYRTQLFTLARPRGDQLSLFLSFCPGGPWPAEDYVLPVDPGVVAASMIYSSHLVGDDHGVYIGRVISGPSQRPREEAGAPILFDPWWAARNNVSPAIAVIGSLGGGKSLAVKTSILYPSLLRGAQAVIIDPKHEYRVLAKAPGLEDRVKVISLGPGSPSSFDPLQVLPHDLAHQTASSLLEWLLRIESESAEALAVDRAIKAELATSDSSMEGVTARLEGLDSPEGQRVRGLLKRYGEHPLARTVFGSPANRNVAGEPETQVTIFDTSQLPLPDASALERGDLKLHHRLAFALLYLATTFALSFVRQGDRRTLRFVVCEEAWQLLRVAEGGELLEELERLGRSYFAPLVLVAQSAKDLARRQGLGGHIPTRWCFKQDSAVEAAAALEFMGLESTPDLVELVQNLGSGQLLIRDSRGRSGLGQIDVVDQELAQLFDTRPESFAGLDDVEDSDVASCEA